jgi:3-oxoacyl-[acyl-carrier protein] reductase
MDLELKDKVAFVAGATRGIGLAVAEAFLREGARVVVTGRDGRAMRESGERLSAAGGADRVLSLQGDLTEGPTIARTLQTTLDVFGGIDAVIANVGSGSGARGWDLSVGDWEASLRTNLLGSMMLASAALPHLVARGGGSLTFISSIAAIEAIDAPIPYGAAKAALLSAMKNLSRLAGPQGVRVNAVAPGNVRFPGGAWDRRLSERPDVFRQYITREVPLQRFGRPEEIADFVLFLSSPRASFVSGACLVVDGGQTRSFS